MLVGNQGKTAKIIGPLYFPCLKSEKIKFIGGDIDYWSPFQKQAFDQVVELFEDYSSPNLHQDEKLPDISIYVDISDL